MDVDLFYDVEPARKSLIDERQNYGKRAEKKGKSGGGEDEPRARTNLAAQGKKSLTRKKKRIMN